MVTSFKLINSYLEVQVYITTGVKYLFTLWKILIELVIHCCEENLRAVPKLKRLSLVPKLKRLSNKARSPRGRETMKHVLKERLNSMQAV